VKTTIRCLAALLLLVALPALAQQSGTVQFDPPNTCVVAGTHAASSAAASTCAPSGYRVYRDGTLVGAITPGGSITFPANGTFVIGVEGFDADGAGPRVNKQVVVGPPPTVPGPVRNFTIIGTCATTNPVTCSFTVSDPAP